MTAPVSACLIVKDDRHVLETIRGLRPYVREIVVGYTPNEKLTEAELLDAEGDVVVRLPGPLVDMGDLRNKTFACANQPYIMWADSDDEVCGLERIDDAIALLDEHPLARLMCPYEYQYDRETGECIWLQMRERIVRNDGRFEWRYPCHETLIAKDGNYGDGPEPRADFLVWKHHREEQPGSPEHDLKCLQAYLPDHQDDPWVHLNLGLTYARLGRHEEAAGHLEQHVAMCGWEDQKAYSMLHLSNEHLAIEGFMAKGAYWQKAQEWAAVALALRPDWFEPYWQLAKIAWMRWSLRGDEESLGTTIEMCRRARLQPDPTHPLGLNLTDRRYAVHDLERTACETREDWRGALEATERALSNRPKDGALRAAKRRYEAVLRLEAAEKEDEGCLPGPRLEDLDKYGPPIPVRQSLDIVFACGTSPEPWNPAVFAEKGLGGSETGVIEMSKRLAAMGHRVRVYTNCQGSGFYDGVEWHDTDSPRASCDVLVAWRSAPLVTSADAKATVIWCHDTTIGNALPYWLVRAQRVLALSEWHKENLIKAHHLAPSQVQVTRNGIDLKRFERGPCAKCGTVSGAGFDGCGKCGHGARDPHKVIYSSSLDRGLQVLLDLWPKIREAVPDASLDVFYGAELWQQIAEQSGDQQKRYSVHAVHRRMLELADHGVAYHGRVNQVELAQAMLGAGAWLMPTHFQETSCIGGMESQAAGLHIVTTELAALPETIGDRGQLIPGDWLSPRYQELFLNASVNALLGPHGWLGWTREALQAEARKRFSWDTVADEWCRLFEELLAEASDGILPEFPAWEAA